MRLSGFRKHVATVLVCSIVMSGIQPSYAQVGLSRESGFDDSIIYEDEDITATPSNGNVATPSNIENTALATPSDLRRVTVATPSQALVDAVKSFNRKVKFVDQEGKKLSSADSLNIPDTGGSFPYLSQGEGRTKGKIDLEAYGYEEAEYFLSGTANVYDIKDQRLATKMSANYVNRVIVFRPESAEAFNGAVFVDILNAGSKVDVPDIWRRSYDYIMTHGYIYVGITSKDVNVSALKAFDEDRYGCLKWQDYNGDTENGLFWDMLGQLGVLLKEDDSSLLYGDETGEVFSYLVGQSQSGWYVNTFCNQFSKANYILENPDDVENPDDIRGEHIFDGFLNVVGGMMDAPIAKRQSDPSAMFSPVGSTDVPFILLVGENDYNPDPVREDSDEPGNLYRHYVIAGGFHTNMISPTDPLDEMQIRAGSQVNDYPPFKSDSGTGRPNTVSDMNMDVFVNAALENLHLWASQGIAAPYGPPSDEIEGSMNGIEFQPDRDEYGNMTTGILSPQFTVPVASYYGGANGSYNTDGGSMVYLNDPAIYSLYEDREDYLEQYGAALDRAIEERWILETDRDLMMRIAEEEPIFGNHGRDDEAIRAAMGERPSFMRSSDNNTSEYKDIEYTVEGTANIYGILRDNVAYKRRMYALPYVNNIRICIPNNFNGEIVLDLIVGAEPEKNIEEYMKAGKAYISIPATPEAARAKGGNWEIPYKENEPRMESGLVWDIISQMVTGIRSGQLIENPLGVKLSIQLGLDRSDADMAYTYELVFSRFDEYGIDSVVSSGNEKPIPLNSLDETMPKDPSKIWSGVIRYQENGAGEPVIGATARQIIEADGKYFKDSNGNGILDDYEDWRLEASVRAEDLVSQMATDDKIGMMFNSSRGMGIMQKDKTKVDGTGLLDEEVKLADDSIFGQTSTLGTTATIADLKLRHFILRQNPQPEDMASWINQMNMVAEGEALGIPVLVTSNSRNENGQMAFGMNDAIGVFSTWPGTLGLAAAAKGDIANGKDAGLISRFANIGREEWDASGLKKGYMYMADTMTDPRWQRTRGTLGEDPEFIADAMARIVSGYQGGSNGVQADGVALTVKHFPGGGARENGFDPHYAQGQWNVYQTEDSLQQYHLPGFKAAVENNVSSIMPFYAKPSAEKSEVQYDNEGRPIPMQAVGFAFNKVFIDELLRNQMGHEGYVNGDGGIINDMAWGVEQLDVAERAALAVNAGTDIIGDTNEVKALKAAYERGVNGYYDGRTIPYGFTKEDVTVTDAALDQANIRLLKEMFQLGLFENPYRDPNHAKEVADNPANWDEAYEAHQKSVVLLKNEENVLPLTVDKLRGKSVYAEYFAKDETGAQTAALRKNLKDQYGLVLTDDYNRADYALLFVNPSSGDYSNATPGYLELDICDGKTIHNVDSDGRPVQSTHEETTLKNAGRIKEISDAVHGHGGKVITNVNFTQAWMLGNVEPYSDAVLAGFDTYTNASMDVITGAFKPTGKMPVTLPKDDTVIAVNAEGVCISPNDVPGYLKDGYMPESMKDENGKAYAYRDSAGNYYELDFGLTYDEQPEQPGRSDGDSDDTGSLYSGHWIQNENGWWFRFDDGTWPSNRWIMLVWDGRLCWYYFNKEGYMVTGWLDYNGSRYYLHPVSDGTQGHMYTGWHLIDGNWYYFHKSPDGTEGRLLTDTATPDGFQVGADGIWIP